MNWIYLDVVDEDILPISEELINKDLKYEGYEIVDNPQITLIPKFESSVNIELPELSPRQTFDVSGLKFWPDMEDPMIVLLDVSNDMVIQLWRDELINQIGKKSIKGKLTPPHITLIKAGNRGDEYDFRLDSKIRNNFLDKCDSIKLPKQINVNDIKMDYWREKI